MKIYTHRAKNDLMAWPPDKVWGPNKIWGARYQPSYPMENFLTEALDNGTCLKKVFPVQVYLLFLKSTAVPVLFNDLPCLRLFEKRLFKQFGEKSMTNQDYERNHLH